MIGVTVTDDRSPLQHHHPIGNLAGMIRVVGRKKTGVPIPPQRANPLQ